MRLINQTMTTAALAALSSLASAADVDPASAIRGSLGASITDLGFDSSGGVLLFVLNAGCVLFFAAIAVMATRSKARRAPRVPLRSKSFAR
jgi:hypothetical protein